MNKLKLLEITFNKLSHDPDHMAYHLIKFMGDEHMQQTELQQLLGCSTEDYYKLALCSAPPLEAVDFRQRVQKIAQYSGTSETAVYQLLKAASFYETKSQPTSFLSECVQLFKKLFSSPAVYQPAFTALLIVCLLLPVFSSRPGLKSLGNYMSSYTHYADSVQHLQPSDNTFVHKNNF